MRIEPLGDQALLATLPDEATAVALATAVRRSNWPWLQDVVPAYSTVGIFFDAEKVRSGHVREQVGALETVGTETDEVAPLIRIPVCYERQLDLARVTEATGLATDDVIRLHTVQEFRVYAIGFVPGFPYMGYLPAELAGVPRLPSPRVRLEPGSVGITGRQTGIYPLARPGGWNILGQTPLTVVDVEDEFFPIRVGDRVRFERIDEGRYNELLGERLERP